MSLLISDAVAAAQSGASGAQPMMGSVFMLVAFAFIFYFLMWRPQSKRAKQHRELISSLNQGDEVITNGGMMGKIAQINEEIVKLTIATGVDISIQKPSIANVLPKGTLKI